MANDYISRQAAIDAVKDWYDGLICGSFKGLKKRLEALPSAQPEVIRCKDCRYASPNGKYGCRLVRFSIHDKDKPLFSDDFCSKAERREE